MGWSKYRKDRLTVIALPPETKCRLIREKARSGKPYGQQICEALARVWGPDPAPGPPVVVNKPPAGDVVMYKGTPMRQQRVTPEERAACPWKV
jgi:hypothetical protein